MFRDGDEDEDDGTIGGRSSMVQAWFASWMMCWDMVKLNKKEEFSF